MTPVNDPPVDGNESQTINEDNPATGNVLLNVADPDGGTQRIFLTGDLGRIDSRGMVEHLGRKDLMVKIRGYRVELEAIETRLAECAGVREAACPSSRTARMTCSASATASGES